MVSNQSSTNRYKPHTRYYVNGVRVPGVTTITGNQLGWNKEVLCRWHNQQGLKDIDTSIYVKEKANAGTLSHAIVTDQLTGKETDYSEYTQAVIKEAENSALSFFEWAKDKKIKPILVEAPLTSEKHRFGGTADIFSEINGANELIDLKSGKGIYPEMIVQVSAYRWLLIEHGYRVDSVRILNIPRTEDEKFLERKVSDKELKAGLRIFLRCLENHRDAKLL